MANRVRKRELKCIKKALADVYQSKAHFNKF